MYGGYIKTVIQLIDPDKDSFDDYLRLARMHPENLEVYGITKSFMVMFDNRGES